MSSGIMSSISEIVSVVGFNVTWFSRAFCAANAIDVALMTMAPSPWMTTDLWLL